MSTELAPVTYGEVKAGLSGFVIAPRGAGQVNIYNGDITNVLLVSRNPTPVAANSLPVEPLTNATIDTTNGQYYASAAPGGGSVTNVTVSSAAQLSPSPAQIAQQIQALGLATEATQLNVKTNTGNTQTSVDSVNFTIGAGTNPRIETLGGVAGRSVAQDMLNANKNVTGELSALIATGTPGGTPGGVPILRGTDNLGSGSAQSIGANATVTLIAATNITKPSFEAVLQLNMGAGVGTVPFAQLNVIWQDSVSGLQVGKKSYILSAGNGVANVHTYYLSGPCRGNQIILTIKNADPAQAETLTWAFNQTSHIYAVDRLLMPTYPGTAPNGFGQPAGNPSKGLLFSSSPTILPSTTVSRLCAPSNAKVKVSIDNGAQANGCAVTFLTPSTSTLYEEAGANQSLFRLVAAAGGQANQEWQMPNGPLNVAMTNQGAANNITPQVTITTMEY